MAAIVIDFFSFLKENNAYISWRHYRKKSMSELCSKDILGVFYFISLSFNWSETKEGSDYWFYLHRAWLHLLAEKYHFDELN